MQSKIDLKKFADRLINFPEIGTLTEPDAIEVRQVPMQTAHEEFAPEAPTQILRLTQCYTCFLLLKH